MTQFLTKHLLCTLEGRQRDGHFIPWSWNNMIVTNSFAKVIFTFAFNSYFIDKKKREIMQIFVTRFLFFYAKKNPKS